MKPLLLLFVLLSHLALGQTTLIPDSAFEQALIDKGYDTGIPDGSVPTANISSVVDLVIFNEDITDLTGIADFTALTELNCGSNQLTSLNVSNNTALTELHCSNNELTILNVSNNITLTYLSCFNNELTDLDVSSNIALTDFTCSNNQLTSLDIGNNTALTDLRCGNNQLTSLDVSNNTALTRLDCYSNQLTSLDVSGCTLLTWFYCDNNQLNCLNMNNGSSQAITSFGAVSNPGLTCIEVDDATWSNANLTLIDPQTSFSNNCNYPVPCGSGTNSILEYTTRDNQFVQITDILGRAILPTTNQVLFYRYTDGRVEKRIMLE